MTVFAFAALLATVAQTNAPPAHVGECKWVHGRFAVYNGSSVQRISLTGAQRIVALRDDATDLPSAIVRYEKSAQPQASLKGDFFVCALESSRARRMQHVRLLRTKNLTFKGISYPPK